MPALSIIMPVYNVERYLREAIESVMSQTYADWELLLVDDGSTDGCPAICDEYADNDWRIKVIHKENGGQGAARNDALAMARGRYVGFVDSDDWIEPYMYARLMEAALMADADMALCGYYLDFKGLQKVKAPLPEAGTYDGSELMREGYLDRKVQSISCDKIFRREIVSDGYPSQRYFEDHATMLGWYAKVRKWVVVPEPMYHYRMRRSGVTNGFSVEKRMAKFHADLERARYISSLAFEKHRMTDAEIGGAVVASAVGTAKSIARSCGDSAMVDHLIAGIVSDSKAYFGSCRGVLSSKVRGRYESMLRNPVWFRIKMRLERLFVFAGNRKEKLLYD